MEKESTNGLQQFINQIELELEFESMNSKVALANFAEEIAIYLELTHGQEIKDSFLDLLNNDERRDKTLKHMRAFLLALMDKPVQSKPKSSVTTKIQNENNISNSVFIVHGHNEEAKEAVARFISKLGLEPVILHERPNNGKTIIEKLESNSENISFAVVLLTPDDKIAIDGDSSVKYRARQNVIYELGFFSAKLSRSRVCVLKKGEVEVLSDYLGVVYVEMDKSGSWKNQLTREIKDAGLPVIAENINKALLS